MIIYYPSDGKFFKSLSHKIMLHMERAAALDDGEEKGGIDPLTSFLDEIATLAVMFRDGRVTFANRNLIQYLGRDDVVGMDEKSFLSVIAPR